jgi:hypothetical protein
VVLRRIKEPTLITVSFFHETHWVIVFSFPEKPGTRGYLQKPKFKVINLAVLGFSENLVVGCYKFKKKIYGNYG